MRMTTTALWLLAIGMLGGCSKPTHEGSQHKTVVSPSQTKPVHEKGKERSELRTKHIAQPHQSRSTPKQEVYPQGRFLSPLSPQVQAAITKLAQKNLELHDDRFIKVGGSGSSTPLLLSCLDSGPIDLGDWTQLKPSLTRFRAKLPTGHSPLSRKSLAAKPGGTAQWVLEGEPSPLQAEIDVVKPRFALVHYGTNDMHQKGTYVSAAQDFSRNMSRLLSQLTQQGIVPIVTSITPRDDHPEANGWIPMFNHSLRALAQYHKVPYLNIHSAILSLPNRGRAADKLHGNVYRQGSVARPCFFGEEALRYTYNVRNLLTIRLLDQLLRLVRGETLPSDDGDVLSGQGTQDKPWMVNGLPFSHRVNTARSTQFVREKYPACKKHKNVDGPEFEYEFTADSTQRVRAFVLSDTNVDADIFLLEKNKKGTDCLSYGARSLTRILVAGSTYRFVIDTRTKDESPKWGEVSLILYPCGENDPVCN